MVKGFCDLNIVFPPQHLNSNRLSQLLSIGYKTIAVNTVIEEEINENAGAKKKKSKAKEPIPEPKMSCNNEVQDRKIQLLKRLTMHFSDANQLQKLVACACKDIDLISFDASERPIMLNRKSYNLALSNGIFFEIPYAPAISDSGKRKNTIQIAHLFHSYGKSKNVILSSGATDIIKIRSPYDVANLGLLFGLTEEQAKHSMLNMCRALIRRAEGRRYGRTAVTVMVDQQLVRGESGDESDDSEPTAKRSKPATESDSQMSVT